MLNVISRKRDVFYEHIKRNEIYTKDYSALNLGLQSAFHKATAPIFIGLDMCESIMRKGGTVEFILKLTR